MARKWIWAWIGASACACGAAAAEPVPVEAFARAGRISSPRLAPDGKHLSVTLNLGEGRHALGIFRIDGMKPTLMLKLPPNEVPMQVGWVSPQRLVVAKGRQSGPREKPQLTGEINAVDLDGGNQKYLFGYDSPGRTIGIDRGFGYIAALPEKSNGRFYMRTLSATSKRSMLYDVDASDGTSRLVADIGERDLSFVLDRTGRARFAIGLDDEDNYLLFQSDAKQRWSPVPSERTGGKLVPFAFSPAGDKVFAWFAADGEPLSLVQAEPDGSGRRTLVEDDFASIGDLQWTATPMQPFAAWKEGGIPAIAYLDENAPATKTHRMLSRSFAGKLVDFVDHSEDGSISLFYVYSDRDPGSWYLFDHRKNAAQLVLAAMEEIPVERMGVRRPIRFKASDGVELDGYLTIPAGVAEPAKLPMVLVPHGGPHAIGDRWPFDLDAQFLASRGYLVLQVNFRGSQGRGKAFEQAGYRQWATRIQDDLIDGVRWSISQGHADPQRICAYGASFGAYSAMISAARAPELFKCAVGFAGIYDLGMMYDKGDIRESAWGRNYLERTIGRDEEALAASSPTSMAPRIKAAVLLVHGESDRRAPFAQAKAMRSALEKAGHPPEWMAVPKEGHGFYKDDNNIEFYRRLETFIGRHIGAAGVPAAG